MVAVVAGDLGDVVRHQGIAGVHVERIEQMVRQWSLGYGADDVVARDLLRLRPTPVPEAVPRAPEVSPHEENQERGEDPRRDASIEEREADAGYQGKPDRNADRAPADRPLRSASCG